MSRKFPVNKHPIRLSLLPVIIVFLGMILLDAMFLLVAAFGEQRTMLKWLISCAIVLQISAILLPATRRQKPGSSFTASMICATIYYSLMVLGMMRHDSYTAPGIALGVLLYLGYNLAWYSYSSLSREGTNHENAD